MKDGKNRPDPQVEVEKPSTNDDKDSATSTATASSSESITAEAFINLFHPDPQGFVGISADVEHWSRAQFRRDVEHLAAERQIHEERRTKGLYFTLCEYEEPRRLAALATRTRAVWADIDRKRQDAPQSVDQLRARCKEVRLPEPTIILETGNGLHTHWIHRSYVDLRRNGKEHRARVQTIGELLGGDPVSDFARVLRVPDTWNFKDSSNPKRVRVVFYSGRMHEAEEFDGLRDPASTADRWFQMPTKPIPESGNDEFAGRDDATIRYLAHRRSSDGLDEEALFEAGKDFNRDWCEPPLADEVIRKKARRLARNIQPHERELYRVSRGRIVEVGYKGRTRFETPLCDFEARIERVIIHDDGETKREVFELRGRDRNGRPLPAIEVSLEDLGRVASFAGWGNRAIVAAAPRSQEKLRHAIQTLSRDAPHEIEYAHTGYRQIDGKVYYLHSGGAIGPEGQREDIRVNLGTPQLGRFRLPSPAEVDARDVFQAFIDAVPDGLAFALLGAVGRSLLGPSDFVLAIIGETGSFKTALAAALQSFFCTDGMNNPDQEAFANFKSTANAIERIQFVVKDALLLIDDFVIDSQGSRRGAQEASHKLERVTRQGGRDRLTRDAGLRPGNQRRCTTLITGEVGASNHGQLGRTWLHEVHRETIEREQLSYLQNLAADGQLALVTANVVQQLVSGDRDRYEAELKNARSEWRTFGGGHARHPDIGADLYVGLRVLFELTGCQDLLQQGREALKQHLRGQAQRAVRESSPALRFPALFRLALNRNTIADRALPFSPPTKAEDWTEEMFGWRPRSAGADGQPSFEPRGPIIGYLDGDLLLLDPDKAYQAIREAAEQEGTSLGVTKTQLWQALEREGMIAGRDPSQLTKSMRFGTGDKKRGRFVVLHAAAVLGDREAEPQSVASGEPSGQRPKNA